MSKRISLRVVVKTEGAAKVTVTATATEKSAQRRKPLEVVQPKNKNGAVMYRGPSMLDGAPIVVIVTGLQGKASENGKTGEMLQTWILREDESPIAALESGADESVCGDCIHRVVDGAGSCYVNVAQGPLAVWKAQRDGSYAVMTPKEVGERIRGRKVRLGAYGDPCAVPVWVWEALLAETDGHTGYTHQWRRAMAQAYRSFLMASVDSEAQLLTAWRKGWRTFRVKSADEEKVRGEGVCPASEEAGKIRTCETCGICDGAARGAGRASVVINVHGLVWKAQRYARAQRALRQKRRYRLAR